MVPDPERPLDDLRDPGERPALRLEAGLARAPPKDPQEMTPLRRAQVGRASRGAPTAQAPDTRTGERLFPVRDRRAADPQVAGDRRQREALGAQEGPRHQSTLLHLLAREPARSPSHHVPSLAADSP